MLKILLVGTGNIASYWLQHFASQLPAGVQVHGIVNSREAQLGNDGLAPSLAFDASYSSEQWITEQIQRLDGKDGTEVVVLDLTASKAISRSYPRWVEAGAHLISANKYAGSANPDFYRLLRDSLSQHQKYWLYNTTVGAGLPIQKAISERLQCHDEILQLEGNFSGSLSWVFQQYRAGQRFSQWLRKAADNGMTEPDPRLDLSGLDVARKLLILAREAWPQEAQGLQLADMDIVSLVPPSLQDCGLDEFWENGQALDAFVSEMTTEPQYHYVGSVKKSTGGAICASATLRPVAQDSPYAHLAPGNANFIIRSRHYDANPLIIQGPGAGREVTAAGIHSDLLDLLTRLEAPVSAR